MLDYFKQELDHSYRVLERLYRDLSRVHPGSKAEDRVKAEVKVAEITVGLWQGRLAEAHTEGSSNA